MDTQSHETGNDASGASKGPCRVGPRPKRYRRGTTQHPLRPAQRRIWLGESPAIVLPEVLGVDLGGRVLRAGTHVLVREGRFLEIPVHSPDSQVVRDGATIALEILGRLGENRRTGHRDQGARLCEVYLGNLIDASETTVRRHLDALYTGGVIDRWQPPETSDAPKGDLSGYCFNIYELFGEIPAVLAALLKPMWLAWEAKIRAIQQRAGRAIVKAAKKAVETAQAIARAAQGLGPLAALLEAPEPSSVPLVLEALKAPVAERQPKGELEARRIADLAQQFLKFKPDG